MLPHGLPRLALLFGPVPIAAKHASSGICFLREAGPFQTFPLKCFGEIRKGSELDCGCKRQFPERMNNQQYRLSSSTEGQQQHFPSS